MKAGDLVKRKMIPDRNFYHLMKMFRDIKYGGLRCEVLCLASGARLVFRPSELKVLGQAGK